MALTLSQLEALRDALLTARLKGVRELTDSNGEQIRYATDREMSAALVDVEQRIAALQAGQRVNTIKFQPSKYGDCT